MMMMMMIDDGFFHYYICLFRYVMFCSHYRSHEWFFESIWNDQCQFVGVLCPNYQMFRNGECSCEDIWFDGHGESTCALMGYDAEYAILNQGLTKYSPQGRWFIKTSDFLSQTNRHCRKHHCYCFFCLLKLIESLFVEYQYQIVIKFGNLVPSVQNGTFVVTMVSAKERTLRPITQELVSPNSAGIRSNYMLTKLILRPHSLPLSRISALYLSFNPHEKDKLWKNTVKLPTMLPVLWVKLSPIHVLNNSPIFFCNFKLSLNLDKSIQLKRCDSV